MLGLYIHIPFCVRKCRYCDFLSAPACDSEREAYLKSLHGQIKAIGERLRQKKSGKHYIVDSIFIGGGTPSLLSSDQMQALMDVVRESFYVADDAEITAECNPGTVTRKKLCAYKRAGINRLSIGLQSADNEELALLGRIHTWEEFLDTFKAARNACFTNINIDIMSALPSEDEVVQMDELTWKLLGEAGYEHYEISNYALPESVCRHNLKYWHCEEYLGVGTGAASYMKTNSSGDYCRLKVITDTKAFSEIDWNDPLSLDKCFAECDILSLQEQMEEMAFLGLRTKEGVRLSSFYERFGKSFNEVYGEVVKKYTAMGMMKADETHVALTLKGMEVANWIMADFCG